MDEIDLASEWSTAWSELGVPARVCQTLWEEVHKRYNEPQRRYHTLTHLEQFMTVAKQLVPPNLVTPEFVLACVWHDVVYDTNRIDNEDKSAELAREWLSDSDVSENVIFDVGALILATKKHEALGGRLSEISSYFLDCDMSILGAAPDSYREYAEAIREEYATIPDDVFKKGRADFLKRTLDKPAIFLTEPFRQRFEQAARENIQSELTALST